MPGYRSHGGKDAPAPSAAKSTEIRDHEWRKVVLVGSSVKSAKDMGPSIQKDVLVPLLWKPQGCGSTDGENESALSIVGKPWVRRVRRSSIAYKRPCHGFVEGVRERERSLQLNSVGNAQIQ